LHTLCEARLISLTVCTLIFKQSLEAVTVTMGDVK